MNTPLDSNRNTWIWQVTILSVVLGMLLAAALKTQQNIRVKWGIQTTRFPGIPQALLESKQKTETLMKDKAALEAKLAQYQEAAGEGSSTTKLLQSDLENAKFMAGLTPVTGAGIEVILQDSRRRPPVDADPDLKAQYIVHDSDIRDFVNELVAAGAEAIAVNDQRIIAKSAIRCVGPTIKVNDTPVGPVIRIQAIGNPDILDSTLKMTGGIMDKWRLLEDLSDMVQIRRNSHIIIPGYSGSTSYRYAKPTEMEAGQ